MRTESTKVSVALGKQKGSSTKRGPAGLGETLPVFVQMLSISFFLLEPEN